MDLLDLYTRIECPYDKSHMITPLRMPYHLNKCRKNHRDVVMAVCPYNATHEMRAPELKYHLTQCPDRNLLERDLPHNAILNVMLGKEECALKGNTDIPPAAKVEWKEEDAAENWDEDESRLVLTPQTSGRANSRRPRQFRHQADSVLRRPQTQSIAASLHQSEADSPGSGGNPVMLHDSDIPSSVAERMRNSNIVKETDESPPSCARVCSSQSREELSGSQPRPGGIYNSRLMQLPSNEPQSILQPNFPLSIGRGRARPALSSLTNLRMQSPPLWDQSGLSGAHSFMLGRGRFRLPLKN